MALTTRLWGVRRAATAISVVTLAVLVPGAPAQADEIRDMQWYLGHLNMPAAWDITEGAGTTVAVLDTGVDASHPDFKDAVIPGIDLTGGGGDGTTAVDEHGTAMAGLIGSRGRGGDGIRGIAPATSILPVTVNSGATIAEGLRWAADHGADVINVSGGTEFQDDPVVRSAVSYALSKDVVVVASAGNGAGPGVDFPGGYGGVITVSALDQQDRLTAVSSYGPEVDLAAPGDVVSLAPDGKYYQTGGGSSAAAAITSGVVALVRSQFPDLDAANVVNRLIATGRDIGAPGQDDEFGYGIVDPVAALTADVPEVSENPLGSPDSDGGGGPGTVPPATDPATQPPATTGDPCATAPGPAGSDGGASPAGALIAGDDCEGFVGVSPGSSNNALGIVVAVGIGVLLLVGVAVFFLRRSRASAGQPAAAYAAPAAPPQSAGPSAPGGWQPPPPAPAPGGWQQPPPSHPGPGGWQLPPPDSGTGGWQPPPSDPGPAAGQPPR